MFSWQFKVWMDSEYDLTSDRSVVRAGIFCSDSLSQGMQQLLLSIPLYAMLAYL